MLFPVQYHEVKQPYWQNCRTLLVGDVKFSAVEVCSEELASRLHPRSGCLPPTRAENSQQYYLARYRLLIDSVEEKKLATAVSNSPSGVASTENYLPSWIGRAFRIKKNQSGDYKNPSNEDLTVLSVGDVTNPPHNNINTEILFTSDLSGIVQKKLSTSININAAEVVETALRLSGIPKIDIPAGLKPDLVEQVIRGGYQLNSTSAGSGAYYYVSMNATQLDSLTSALDICKWAIEPDHANRATVPGETFHALPPNQPLNNCAEKLKENKSIDSSVKALIAALEETAKTHDKLENAGIIIGAAILHTKRGNSEICRQIDIDIIKKDTNTPLKSESCENIRTMLNTYTSTNNLNTTPAAKNPTSSNVTLGEEQKQNLLISLEAAYANSSFKTIAIQPHTGILALHWLPIILPKE